ncbi:MAG TPA: M28 family peptidase, partial [Abditibacteriaceae bacterium]
MNQRDARRLAAVFLLCIVAGCASFWIARWMARRSQNEPVVVNPTPTQTRPRRVVTRPSLAPVFTPTPSKTDSVALALQKLDKAALLEHAQHLSGSIGPRLAGTRAERRAADYIEAQFRAYGYAPQREDFITKKGGRSCNVIARRALPGQRQIVVGAHFDSVRVAPGANDNASGVAVLLELARVLANEKTPVRFIAFGAEERWEKQYLVKAHRLNGSNQHVSGLGDEKRLIKAMISL